MKTLFTWKKITFGAALAFGLSVQPGISQIVPVSLTAGPIKFKMYNIDNAHRSEGTAVADVDKDGDMDILVGDYWYETKPNSTWTIHEIRTPGVYAVTDYSEAFVCYADDFNNDTYPDLLVMPYGGKEVKWYENPKGGAGRWTAHSVGYSYYNEQPIFVDVLGTGQKYLISSNTAAQFAYYRPGTDAAAAWNKVAISQAGAPNGNQWDHGMGIGDINCDGRKDFITQEGWYENPVSQGVNWAFHPSKFNTISPEQPSNIYPYDINKDGKMDLVTANAHGYGVWWYEQLAGNTWKTHTIDDAVSENHSMNFDDMDNDGSPDIITGKRWYAHNGADPGGNDPAILYWIKYTVAAGVPTFTKYVIYNNSGIGINFQTGDFNGDGLKDICISNKKGVKMYYQEGTAVGVGKSAIRVGKNLKIDVQRLSSRMMTTFKTDGAYLFRAIGINGKTVFCRKGTQAGAYQFELRDLPTGVYTLELESLGNKVSRMVAN